MPNDEYTITVTFKRSRSDDLDCARSKRPSSGLPDHELLMRQFRDELQAAYDDGHYAGEFQITSVDGVTVEPR
jgi:hypothetical protein